MKITPYLLIALVGFQELHAGTNGMQTELKCFQGPKESFSVKMLTPSVHSVTPYDDALLVLKEPQSKVLPMNLIATNKGSLFTQKTYAIYGGGKLVIAESLIGGIGCGRRLCDFDNGSTKTTANLLTTNGQSYVFNCF